MSNSFALRICGFLASSNIFIALCAAAFCASTCWYLGQIPSLSLLIFVFSATLFTYNYQRMVGDLDGSGPYRRVRYILMGASLLASGFIVWQLKLSTVALMLVAGVLSLGYAMPLISRKGVGVSLRKIPHLKLPLIVIAWLLACVAAPVAEVVWQQSLVSWSELVLLAIQQGMVVAALAIVTDIRDLPYDDPSQRTLPQRLGVPGAVSLARSLVRVAALAAALNYLTGNMSLQSLLTALITALTLSIIVAKTHAQRPPHFFEILADGVLLIPVLIKLVVWLSQI